MKTEDALTHAILLNFEAEEYLRMARLKLSEATETLLDLAASSGPQPPADMWVKIMARIRNSIRSERIDACIDGADATADTTDAMSVSTAKLSQGIPCESPLHSEALTHACVIPDAEAKDEPPSHPV